MPRVQRNLYSLWRMGATVREEGRQVKRTRMASAVENSQVIVVEDKDEDEVRSSSLVAGEYFEPASLGG